MTSNILNSPSQVLAKSLSLSFILALTACSQSYVVLLEEDDGSLGKVQVTTAQGSTLL